MGAAPSLTGLQVVPATPDRWRDVVTVGGRVDTSFGDVGVTPMFEKAGFRRIVETDARSHRRPRILVRLDFAPDGERITA